MANINPLNNGIAIGRLASDHKEFANSDGSKSIMFTLMIQDNFKGADGTYGAHALDFRAFAPKDGGTKVYDYLTKGQLVAVTYEPRLNRFTDKAGVEHFDIILRVNDVRLLGSRPAGGAEAVDEPIVEAEDDVVDIDAIL